MEKIICIFGASSTWGAWDYEKGGWVNRLRLYLDSKDSDIFLYNLGVSGDTTKDLLKRFDCECKARKPDLLIFSIGDNDSIYIPSEKKNLVSLTQFEINFENLISKAKKYSKDIIFLGFKKIDENKTTPIPWKTEYHYTNEYINLYDKKLESICKKNKVQYLKMYDLLQNKDFEDGLHPNTSGHQKMYLKIKSYLIKNKLI